MSKLKRKINFTKELKEETTKKIGPMFFYKNNKLNILIKDDEIENNWNFKKEIREKNMTKFEKIKNNKLNDEIEKQNNNLKRVNDKNNKSKEWLILKYPRLSRLPWNFNC